MLGPESTGKSTLCEQLAEHYKTIWVPEYAREYLEKNGSDYSYEDLLEIAKGQLAAERAAETGAKNNLLIIDTDMHVMKVWCDFVFGKTHSFIEEALAKNEHDLYLLCAPDLPWVKDELREYPDLETRQKLFGIYKAMMEKQIKPWVEINGDYEERLQKAIKAIDGLHIR